MLKKLYRFSQSWIGTIIIVLFIICFLAQAYIIPSGSMKNTLLVGDFLFGKKFSYGIPIPHLPWVELPLLPDFNKNGHLIKGEGPKRGDIVIFRNPLNPKVYFVKRCVGVEGDEIIYSNKTLYISMAEGEDYMKANYDKNDLITINNKIFVKEPYKQAGIHNDDNSNIEYNMIISSINGLLAMKPIIIDGFGEINQSGGNAYQYIVEKDNYFMMGDNRDHSNDSRFWGSVEYKYIVGQPWFVYFSIDEDYNIRWDRIGRFVDTLQNNKKFIKKHSSNFDDLE